MRKARTHNISYPSSAAAVVFGVHLSARVAFRLDLASGETIPLLSRDCIAWQRTRIAAKKYTMEWWGSKLNRK